MVAHRAARSPERALGRLYDLCQTAAAALDPQMFDLRYHVASLAAVFLALVIGILVGVGISRRGLVDDAERKLLNEQIASLQSRARRRDEARRADQARERSGRADLRRATPTRR